MKLVSFNVNSIRAIVQKDFKEDFFKLNPDIIGLQETKLSDDSEGSFPFVPEGYNPYWSISKVKKGYSGTAVLTKIKPIGVHYGLKNGLYDDEGRVTTLEFENFFFISCYSPNSQDELRRLGFRLEFDANLREFLMELDQKKPVILCGDLNVAHNEIDIKHPKANMRNSGFTIEERTAFSQLLDCGFSDSFRCLYPETVKYSWWSYRFNARKSNAGWRIDYFVVSNRLLPLVKEAEIHNDIFGSDHCPVSIDIDL